MEYKKTMMFGMLLMVMVSFAVAAIPTICIKGEPEYDLSACITASDGKPLGELTGLDSETLEQTIADIAKNADGFTDDEKEMIRKAINSADVDDGERLAIFKGLQKAQSGDDGNKDAVKQVLGENIVLDEGSLDGVASVDFVEANDDKPARYEFKRDGKSTLVIPTENVPGDVDSITLGKDNVVYKKGDGELQIGNDAYVQDAGEDAENDRWQVEGVENLDEENKAFVKVKDGGVIEMTEDGKISARGSAYWMVQDKDGHESSFSAAKGEGSKLTLSVDDDGALNIEGSVGGGKGVYEAEGGEIMNIDIAAGAKGKINMFGDFDENDPQATGLSLRAQEAGFSVSGNIEDMNGVSLKFKPGTEVSGSVTPKNGQTVTFGSDDEDYDFRANNNFVRITEGNVNVRPTSSAGINPDAQGNYASVPGQGQMPQALPQSQVPQAVLSGQAARVTRVGNVDYSNQNVRAVGNDYFIQTAEGQWAPTSISNLAGGYVGSTTQPTGYPQYGAMGGTCSGGSCAVGGRSVTPAQVCQGGSCSSGYSQRVCGPGGCRTRGWLQPFGDARNAAFPVVGGGLRAVGNVAANAVAFPFRARRALQQRTGYRFPVLGAPVRVIGRGIAWRASTGRVFPRLWGHRRWR